jgi:hypothetical protein
MLLVAAAAATHADTALSTCAGAAPCIVDTTLRTFAAAAAAPKTPATIALSVAAVIASCFTYGCLVDCCDGSSDFCGVCFVLFCGGIVPFGVSIVACCSGVCDVFWGCSLIDLCSSSAVCINRTVRFRGGGDDLRGDLFVYSCRGSALFAETASETAAAVMLCEAETALKTTATALATPAVSALSHFAA